VVNALPSLWPKELALTPESATLVVRKPDGSLQRVRDVPPDTWILFEDGQEVGALQEVFKATHHANFPKVVEMVGLADITEDMDRFFVMGYGPPWIVHTSGEPKHLYVRWEESDPPELHLIEQAEFRGKATIRVGEIPLHHRRLGEVTYAYGEGKVGDRPMLLVVSEDDGGGKATIRLRPTPQDD
jgi:hypothetical protein